MISFENFTTGSRLSPIRIGLALLKLRPTFALLLFVVKRAKFRIESDSPEARMATISFIAAEKTTDTSFFESPVSDAIFSINSLLLIIRSIIRIIWCYFRFQSRRIGVLSFSFYDSLLISVDIGLRFYVKGLISYLFDIR